jgi:hypothetical protein
MVSTTQLSSLVPNTTINLKKVRYVYFADWMAVNTLNITNPIVLNFVSTQTVMMQNVNLDGFSLQINLNGLYRTANVTMTHSTFENTGSLFLMSNQSLDVRLQAQYLMLYNNT